MDPRDETVELGQPLRAKRRCGIPSAGRSDRTAAAKNLLARRKAPARLLLIADERQIRVEEVERGVYFSRRHEGKDFDQHLRVGEAGHRAVGKAETLARCTEHDVP